MSLPIRLANARRGAVAVLLAVLVAGLLGVVGAAHAQGVPGTGANACLAGKTLCLRKKVFGLLGCRAKCQKNPKACGQAQADCEARVQKQFDGGSDPAKGCFAKLEAKAKAGKPASLCTTSGDAAKMEVIADADVRSMTGLLESTPPAQCPLPCTAAMLSFYAHDFSGHVLTPSCSFDALAQAGSVSLSAFRNDNDQDLLSLTGGHCMVFTTSILTFSSTPVTSAEQAACAPLAAQIVTAVSGQPCNVYP
jgi:hypothetical protein